MAPGGRAGPGRGRHLGGYDRQGAAGRHGREGHPRGGRRPGPRPDLREIRLEVDDELPGLIAHDLLSNPDSRAAIAPTLQVILSQLWDHVKDNSRRRYTVDLYNALKGEGLLLRDFLDKQLKQLKQSHPERGGEGVRPGVARGPHDPVGYGRSSLLGRSAGSSASRWLGSRACSNG